MKNFRRLMYVFLAIIVIGICDIKSYAMEPGIIINAYDQEFRDVNENRVYILQSKGSVDGRYNGQELGGKYKSVALLLFI